MITLRKLAGFGPPPLPRLPSPGLSEADHARMAGRSRSDPTLAQTLAGLAPLAALIDQPQPEDRARCERELQQNLRHRGRAQRVLEQLQAGQGVAPFHPQDPTGAHYCWRHDRDVLEVRPHRAFLTGREEGFRLYLSPQNVMVQRDGAWVPDPDDAFFDAFDAAWQGSATFRM